MDGSCDSTILNYFESTVRKFIRERLEGIVDNWWNACIPPEIRKDASQRHKQEKKINDILNKPDYGMMEYINFDGYKKIIARRDNWKNYFEEIFRDKRIFEYKMDVILSLRNDVRHGRKLDMRNHYRLRLECYDILSQIYEKKYLEKFDRKKLDQKFGFDL